MEQNASHAEDLTTRDDPIIVTAYDLERGAGLHPAFRSRLPRAIVRTLAEAKAGSTSSGRIDLLLARCESLTRPPPSRHVEHAWLERASAGSLAQATVGVGTVQSVRPRPPIDLDLTIDGGAVDSETTCSWGGAHVLTIHTVIPRADLALELHSTFVGHPGLRTHVVHLRLGPPGHEPSLSTVDADDGELEPTYAARACAYEHAQRLIEVLYLRHFAAVNVPDESTFDSLERIGPGIE